MSQIRRVAVLLSLAFVALFSIVTAGCSDANKNTIFDSGSGKHPENWYTGHRTAYLADRNACFECHGTDLHGGTSAVSCFSGSFNGLSCHASGPAGHPADWLPQKHCLAAQADLNLCKACHGTQLDGGIAGVSCTLCHIGGPESVHPLDWQDNSASPLGVSKHRWYVIQNGTVSCANQYCHGANLGGVATSGVDCKSCHTNNIPMVDNCNGCHGFPQATNKHTQHLSLQDVDCSVCHLGNHQGVMPHTVPGAVKALMNFQSIYTAKSGTTVSFDSAANTCSKVSCHGGQSTPDWTSAATFDVNTQCTSCHAYGTTEYNSFASGRHDSHVNTRGTICTACHGTTLLAQNHFTALNTQVLEGPAAATIGALVDTYTGTNGASGSCTTACHTSPSVPRAWF